MLYIHLRAMLTHCKNSFTYIYLPTNVPFFKEKERENTIYYLRIYITPTCKKNCHSNALKLVQ